VQWSELTDILQPESSSFYCRIGVRRQRHVIGRGVDGNVRRPIAELRAGAVRMLSAELKPIVFAHRFARRRRQLYVLYVEDDLGVFTSGRQQTMAVGFRRIRRRIIHRTDVTNTVIARRSALLLSTSVTSTDVATLVVVY